ncbi:hypothetical protein RvY_00092 [Ramazzottius varieornatus]|uniref:Uncharacterized protein n=1 Tax=Ramazzottius varieornatus TaxID=947166 RepID=A0A1D1UBH8_RAMVA|nr:hypothetical protein RvY_00092 [Ramazzottius varieornatus]
MTKILDAKLYDKAKRIQNLGHLNDPVTDGNQQVIKISDEIDYMVEKLSDLDALKQSKNKLTEEAATLQLQLDSLKSEDTWSKIRTDLDVAETLLKQTKEEHQGHLNNLDHRRTQLTDLYERLRDGQKEKEQVAQKIGENKMAIVEAFQESRDAHAAGLGIKDKDQENITYEFVHMVVSVNTTTAANSLGDYADR